MDKKKPYELANEKLKKLAEKDQMYTLDRNLRRRELKRLKLWKNIFGLISETYISLILNGNINPESEEGTKIFLRLDDKWRAFARTQIKKYIDTSLFNNSTKRMDFTNRFSEFIEEFVKENRDSLPKDPKDIEVQVERELIFSDYPEVINEMWKLCDQAVSKKYTREVLKELYGISTRASKAKTINNVVSKLTDAQKEEILRVLLSE